jgi:hypothetical protein
VTPFEKGVLSLEIILAAAILVGLAMRGRYRSSISFDIYLLSIVVFELLLLVWPGRFFTWDYWFTKETVQSFLKVAVTVELSVRLFWRLPRARATAALGLVLITAGTLLSVVDVDSADAELRAQSMMPRIFYGTAIMFGLILTLALWYRVSLNELHKAILMGFTPYLLASTVGVQLLDAFGGGVRVSMNYLNNLAFFGLLGYWVRVAWKQPSVEPIDTL